MMSYPVTKTLFGKYLSSNSLLSGQPSVENGHKALENQVSKTSGSCTQSSPGLST